MGFIRMPKFIRRLIRRKLTPIAYEVALNKRKVLSLVYAMLAWNILGLVGYSFYKQKRNNSEEGIKYQFWRGNIYSSTTPHTYVVNIPKLSSNLVKTDPEPELETSSKEN